MTPRFSGLPWLKWWPRDFDASTRGWPLDATGAYIRLLNAAWDQDGLPDDPRALSAIAGATARQWRSLWPEYLASKFPADESGRLRNPRLERARADAVEQSDKQREKARKRWRGQVVPIDAAAMPRDMPLDMPEGMPQWHMPEGMPSRGQRLDARSRNSYEGELSRDGAEAGGLGDGC